MVKYADFKRVTGACDLLGIAGKWLKRRTIKFTSASVLLAGVMLLTDYCGNKAFGYDLPVTKADAIKFPVAAAVITLGLGSVCTFLANTFGSGRMLQAEANFINLMEDRKKVDMDYHLDTLWERVFKYESQLRNDATAKTLESQLIQKHREDMIHDISEWPADRLQRLGVDPANQHDLGEIVKRIECFRPLSSNMEATKEGYLESAKYALINKYPIIVEMNNIGFNLSLVEDWYDGAFFHNNDCKLGEQFFGNNAIVATRKKAGIPLTTKALFGLFGYSSPIFFKLTMNKVANKVGTLIQKFNSKEGVFDRTKPTYFNAQHFLWDDEASDMLVKQRFGSEILDRLIAARKELIREVFSDDKGVAHAHVFEIFKEDYRRAMDLRLDYDVAFAAGYDMDYDNEFKNFAFNRLDYDPIQDIEEMDRITTCFTYTNVGLGRKIQRAENNIQDCMRYIDHTMPGLKPLQMRAALIGYYLNRFGIQKKVKENRLIPATEDLRRIASAEDRYSERLCMVRQHYELVRMQIKSYISMVDRLGQFESPLRLGV